MSLFEKIYLKSMRLLCIQDKRGYTQVGGAETVTFQKGKYYETLPDGLTVEALCRMYGPRVMDSLITLKGDNGLINTFHIHFIKDAYFPDYQIYFQTLETVRNNKLDQLL